MNDKTVKRFFFKIILIPFVLLLFVLNSAYKSSFYWKTQRVPSKFLNVPDNIELANLGSSQGHCSFNYEAFPEYKCFNFAVPWQHNKYNYYVLKQYADKLAPGAVLLIPIAYFDITRIEKDVYENYYGILDRKNFPDWNIKDWFEVEILPVCFTKDVWKKLRMNQEKFSAFIPKRIPIPENDLILQSEGTFYTWTEKNEAEQGEKGFEYNIEMMSEIIDFCYKNDIVPVMVSTPQIDVLNNLYVQIDFFDTFCRFTDELKKKYPALIYFDYSRNKEYANDSSLFSDVAHLNICGAKKFTAQIVQDLKDANLLQ